MVLYRKEWDEEGGLTEQTYNVCDSLTEGRRKKARTRVTLVGSRFCWKSLEGSIEKERKPAQNHNFGTSALFPTCLSFLHT